MRELRVSDAELQAVIGAPLRAFLRAKGFQPGCRSDDNTSWWFPINLELAGTIDVVRTEDGVWNFKQEDPAITDRLADAGIMHAASIMARDHRGGGGA